MKTVAPQLEFDLTERTVPQPSVFPAPPPVKRADSVRETEERHEREAAKRMEQLEIDFTPAPRLRVPESEPCRGYHYFPCLSEEPWYSPCYINSSPGIQLYRGSNIEDLWICSLLLPPTIDKDSWEARLFAAEVLRGVDQRGVLLDLAYKR